MYQRRSTSDQHGSPRRARCRRRVRAHMRHFRSLRRRHAAAYLCGGIPWMTSRSVACGWSTAALSVVLLVAAKLRSSSSFLARRSKPMYGREARAEYSDSVYAARHWDGRPGLCTGAPSPRRRVTPSGSSRPDISRRRWPTERYWTWPGSAVSCAHVEQPFQHGRRATQPVVLVLVRDPGTGIAHPIDRV